MGNLILTKTRIADGIWEGRLQQEDARADTPAPAIRISLSGKPVPGAELEVHEATLGLYTLRVPIPNEALGDGIHTFLIIDDATGQTLGDFSIAVGVPLESDIRTELDLLRAELDLLKRAFRRHCVETG